MRLRTSAARIACIASTGFDSLSDLMLPVDSAIGFACSLPLSAVIVQASSRAMGTSLTAVPAQDIGWFKHVLLAPRTDLLFSSFASGHIW
jgi:hypothetical protein